MRQINECKVVQDLLPNFADKLTNEDSNKFIEEHLKDCQDCQEKLNRMTKNINVNNLTQEKEIKYLKKYKNRIITIVVSVVTIALIIIAYLWFFIVPNYLIQVDGSKDTTKQEMSQMLGLSYINATYDAITSSSLESREDFIVKVKFLFTFSENGKVIDARARVDGYSPEELQSQYNTMIEQDFWYNNVSKKDNCLYYNTVLWNGYTKQELIDKFNSIFGGFLYEEL